MEFILNIDKLKNGTAPEKIINQVLDTKIIYLKKYN